MRLSLISLLTIVALAPRVCDAQSRTGTKKERAASNTRAAELEKQISELGKRVATWRRQNADDLKQNAEMQNQILKLEYAESLRDLAIANIVSLQQAGSTIGVTASPADTVLRRLIPATKGKYGLVVTNVVKGSPADVAGVKQHDLILSAAGKSLSDEEELRAAVKTAAHTLSLAGLRSGRPFKLTVRLPKRKIEVALTKELVEALRNAESNFVIGVSIEPASKTLVKQLGLPPSTGCVITLVVAKGPAAQAGLEEHDIILRIGNKVVDGLESAARELNRTKGKPVAIEFLRAGRKLTRMVKPTRRHASRLIPSRKAKAELLRDKLENERRLRELNEESKRISKQRDDLLKQANKVLEELEKSQESMERDKKKK